MAVLLTEQIKAAPLARRKPGRKRQPFMTVHGSSVMSKYQRQEILEDVFVPAAHKQWGKGRRKDPKGRIYALGCDRQAYGVKQCDAKAKTKEKGFVLYHLKTYKFLSWKSLKGNKHRRFRKEFKRKLKIVLGRSNFKLVKTSLAKLSEEKRAEFMYDTVFRIAAGLKPPKPPKRPSAMGGLGGAVSSKRQTRVTHL